MWTAFVLGPRARRRHLVHPAGGQWVIPLADGALLPRSGRTRPHAVAVRRREGARRSSRRCSCCSPRCRSWTSTRPGSRSPRWWHVLAPILAVVLVVKVGVLELACAAHQPGRPDGAHRRAALAATAADGPEGAVPGQRRLRAAGSSPASTRARPWSSASRRCRRARRSRGRTAQPLDFDSLPPELYNDVRLGHHAARRAPAARRPRACGSCAARRRSTSTGASAPFPPRSVLAEGDAAGRVLRCTHEGRPRAAAPRRRRARPRPAGRPPRVPAARARRDARPVAAADRRDMGPRAALLLPAAARGARRRQALRASGVAGPSRACACRRARSPSRWRGPCRFTVGVGRRTALDAAPRWSLPARGRRDAGAGRGASCRCARPAGATSTGTAGPRLEFSARCRPATARRCGRGSPAARPRCRT